MENLKLLSETLLDNYTITIDMKKECTRLFLGLASPLNSILMMPNQDMVQTRYLS